MPDNEPPLGGFAVIKHNPTGECSPDCAFYREIDDGSPLQCTIRLTDRIEDFRMWPSERCVPGTYRLVREGD